MNDRRRERLDRDWSRWTGRGPLMTGGVLFGVALAGAVLVPLGVLSTRRRLRRGLSETGGSAPAH